MLSNFGYFVEFWVCACMYGIAISIYIHAFTSDTYQRYFGYKMIYSSKNNDVNLVASNELSELVSSSFLYKSVQFYLLRWLKILFNGKQKEHDIFKLIEST